LPIKQAESFVILFIQSLSKPMVCLYVFFHLMILIISMVSKAVRPRAAHMNTCLPEPLCGQSPSSLPLRELLPASFPTGILTTDSAALRKAYGKGR
jgi:hypothetical protein